MKYKFSERIAPFPKKDVKWLTKSQVQRLYTGQCQPGYISLVRFVEATGMSADYLLGIVDEPIMIIGIRDDYLDLKSRIDLTAICNVNHQTRERIATDYLPNAVMLIRIARCLNVTIDYLIGAVRNEKDLQI